MSIENDLQELQEAGIINKDTALAIRSYYSQTGNTTSNRLLLVFGILGALLIGLGVILIVAHNWDNLGRTTKTILAFLPLIIGQIACAFFIFKKPDSLPWKEASGTFLFLAVGACIALISQIYHLPGEMSSFILCWALLCLPIIYVLPSSTASLLYLLAVSSYAMSSSWDSSATYSPLLYWPLLAAVAPYYYFLIKNKARSNFTHFHHWAIPLSLIIGLFTFADSSLYWQSVNSILLFASFYLIGSLPHFENKKIWHHGYTLLGLLGTLRILFTFSFDWLWKDLRRDNFDWYELLSSTEFVASIVLLAITMYLLFMRYRAKDVAGINLISISFLFFIPVFVLGFYSGVAPVFINTWILLIGVTTIWQGAKSDSLAKLNLGLLIITVLIACRFFDTDVSFLIRGLIFLSIGIGFFGANYWLLKKRNGDA
ncbi:DUF2157 domain-containing protein [Chitinophagales bacterium]|nr:DUF2157 domain-containing protein [Chitinophagales bacterium]